MARVPELLTDGKQTGQATTDGLSLHQKLLVAATIKLRVVSFNMSLCIVNDLILINHAHSINLGMYSRPNGRFGLRATCAAQAKNVAPTMNVAPRPALLE
jgi:hypothetical protein